MYTGRLQTLLWCYLTCVSRYFVHSVSMLVLQVRYSCYYNILLAKSTSLQHLRISIHLYMYSNNLIQAQLYIHVHQPNVKSSSLSNTSESQFTYTHTCMQTHSRSYVPHPEWSFHSLWTSSSVWESIRTSYDIASGGTHYQYHLPFIL